MSIMSEIYDLNKLLTNLKSRLKDNLIENERLEIFKEVNHVKAIIIEVLSDYLKSFKYDWRANATLVSNNEVLKKKETDPQSWEFKELITELISLYNKLANPYITDVERENIQSLLEGIKARLLALNLRNQPETQS